MLPVTDLLIHGKIREDVPTLVLLHVFGQSRREWIETGILLGSQCRVISIDTPGFGDAADVPGYTVSEMADQFTETIEALRLKSFTLVGHSMTGKVSAVLAHRKLPGLEKLVLLTPSPVSPEPMADADRKTMLSQAHPSQQDAEEYIRSNSALPIKPEVFERAVEDRLRTNPAAWTHWIEHGSHEDWSERVGTLSLPTLVIAAEKDKSLGPAVQREHTMPHFGNVRLETVIGSGHMVPMEAPDRLATLLTDFVGGK